MNEGFLLLNSKYIDYTHNICWLPQLILAKSALGCCEVLIIMNIKLVIYVSELHTDSSYSSLHVLETFLGQIGGTLSRVP